MLRPDSRYVHKILDKPLNSKGSELLQLFVTITRSDNSYILMHITEIELVLSSILKAVHLLLEMLS